VEEIGLPGMLLLQEQPDSADERAKKRGQELLATLAELQRALLAGDERHSPALAATLTTLAGDLPQASDPALRATVQAIALRARIEAMRLNPRPAG
jgi:NADPH-dependent ferric siderophore reductase